MRMTCRSLNISLILICSQFLSCKQENISLDERLHNTKNCFKEGKGYLDLAYKDRISAVYVEELFSNNNNLFLASLTTADTGVKLTISWLADKPDAVGLKVLNPIALEKDIKILFPGDDQSFLQHQSLNYVHYYLRFEWKNQDTPTVLITPNSNVVLINEKGEPISNELPLEIISEKDAFDRARKAGVKFIQDLDEQPSQDIRGTNATVGIPRVPDAEAKPAPEGKPKFEE